MQVSIYDIGMLTGSSPFITSADSEYKCRLW